MTEKRFTSDNVYSKKLDNIFEVFVNILKLKRKIDNFNYQDVDDALIEIQAMKNCIQYNVKKMEKLINEYFGRTHFFNKLSVEYDDEWEHFMIKQPLNHKIKRNDVLFIALEKCLNDYDKLKEEGLRNAHHLGVRYAVSLNLIDLPL